MDKNSLSQNRLSETLRSETSQLQRAWGRHQSDFLDSYLVHGVQDPRINLQSIFTRHFLIREIFKDCDGDEIMDHELRFALTANWLLGLLKSTLRAYEINGQMNAILEILLDNKNITDSIDVSAFLANTFRQLSFPNYISDFLTWVPQENHENNIPDYLLNTFQEIWSQTLDVEQAKSISVVELACGSANDYRFLCSFGLSKFLRYTGFDLCEKNIHNAKAMHPASDFRVGNVFEIPAEDNAYEYCFVHDLLEHLSPEGIEKAIRDICRVTLKKICIHFFNMDDANEHQINQTHDYHLNRLSRKHICHAFQNDADKIEAVHINTFVEKRFACTYPLNKQAWTLFIELKQ